MCIRSIAQSSVPTVDGEAGPCSVEFSARDGNGSPVHAAQIQVHIKYGLFGLRQLDLQVATDAQGKARFDGLPDDTDGVLFFEASTDELQGVAAYYPSSECHARHSIYMGNR